MIKAWLPFKHEEKSDGGGGVGSLLRVAAIAVVAGLVLINVLGLCITYGSLTAG